MQRRVGQHQPQPGGAGRDRGSERRPLASPHEHDRACCALEQRLFLRRELGQRARVVRHHRERLLLAELARPQACDSLLVCRVAGEVIAAEPLHGHDAPVAEQSHRLLQRQRETRPAVRARGRLGVEAAVGRILVLAAAGGAQRKPGHRRVGAVVRNGGDDGEARPAVRAVHERVAVAAVGRVEELAQAVVAGGGVGWDQGRRACGRVVARDDREARVRSHRAGGRHDLVDAGERRSLRDERCRELLQRRDVALCLDQHAVRVVEHEAGQSVPRREPVHERPEADPLHHPPHAQALPLDGLDSRHVPRLPGPGPTRNGSAADGTAAFPYRPGEAVPMTPCASESTLMLLPLA